MLPLMIASMAAFMTASAGCNMAKSAVHRSRVAVHKATGTQMQSTPVKGVSMISFFVQVGAKHLCFTVPDTTTIGDIKTMAFFRQGSKVATTLGRHRLMKGKGSPLEDGRTLSSYKVAENQTLFLTATAPGGARIEDEINGAERALFDLRHAIDNNTMPDAMRQQFIVVYNASVERLKELYTEAGADPEQLPDRDGAIVNPSPYPSAIQDPGGDGGDWGGDWGGGASDADDADDADEQMSQASEDGVERPPETVESEMWKRANKHPAHDPRIKKPGMQWIPDRYIEAAFRESDKNPNGKGEPYTLDAGDKARCMGARKIDHSLSGLSESKYQEVIQKIGIQFHCGSKQADVIRPNFDGSITRVLSTILDSVPCASALISVVNVMLGRAQGGKSYEGVTDCWAKYFVHATLPIYYVRNLGGLNDTNEICKDFDNFNDDVKAYLQKLKAEQPGCFGWLNDAEISKFMLTPKLMSDHKSNRDKRRIGLEVELVDVSEISTQWAEEAELENNGAHKAVRLTHPQVIVGLMNKSTITKFMHTGCVLPPAYQFDLDDSGTKVSRGEALKVFIGGKKQGRMCTAKITPFSLFFGVHSVSVTFQPMGKRSAATASSSHPGEAMLHSAYGPCCWDTSSLFDQATNAKRGRMSRLVDEVDTTTSENRKHVIGDYNHRSSEVEGFANMALDKGAHDKMKSAQQDVNNAVSELVILQAKLKSAMADLRVFENGGIPAQTAGEAVEAANAARSARAAARASGGAVGRADGPNYAEASESELSDDEDSDNGDNSDNDDDNASSVGSSVSTNNRQKAERQAERVATQKAFIESLEAKIEELDESRKHFEDAEEKAMKRASLHIQGMSAAAMYNVGITATIFGCMQRHRGGKTQTRLAKMPTPEAYNDLCKWDEVAQEWRLLINPTQRAKKGSIKIIEAPVKRLGFFDMNSSANRNRYIEKWMLEKGYASRNESNCVVPQEPVQRANARGSYTIRPAWYEHDPSKGEEPEYPWVAQMMDDFLKAKKMQTRRMHNSWARNSEMFTTALTELQSQRQPLKKVRRCAQGMIISGETRFTRSKDHLITDLFARCGHAAGEPMHDVCAYNYAGERLSLYFRPETLDERLVENIVEDPDSFLPVLKNYLSGDPTMHYKYKQDPVTGLWKTKLSDEWIRRHYIAPIRDELARSVLRKPVSAAQMAAYNQRVQTAKDQGRDHDEGAIPRPVGRVKFETETKTCVDALTQEQIGEPFELTRIDFQKPTPQPRFMATLFTVIDAHRFHQDGANMLPMPFVGMTKTAGGRAQRYMCHGHRSRIQVHVHTFDIFPNRRLGLAMCDAIQEGFRAAGFDEKERFGTEADRADSGCTGEWMEDWVDQVYVSTKDFVPLLQNALMTQEEWVRLLTKEQFDPRRATEPAPQQRGDVDLYAKRLMESPTDTLERVIGGEVTECFRQALHVWISLGRAPTRNDMPYTDYPNMHTWLIAHVNRAPSTKMRFLRQSNQTNNEDAIRATVMDMCKGYLRAEVAAREDEGSDVRDKFDEMVEALDERFDQNDQFTSLGLDASHEANVERVENTFLGKIPLPRYSEAHAPGGDLDARDAAEANHYHQALRELLAGRDTIAEQYEANHGKGFAFTHARTKKAAKEATLVAGAERMRAEEEPTDGGPVKYLSYKAATIRAWLKEVDGGIQRGGRRNANPTLELPEEGTDRDRMAIDNFRTIVGQAINAHPVAPSHEHANRGIDYGIFNDVDELNHMRERVDRLCDRNGQGCIFTKVSFFPDKARRGSGAGTFNHCVANRFFDRFQQRSSADNAATAIKWACIAVRDMNKPQAQKGGQLDVNFNLREFIDGLVPPQA